MKIIITSIMLLFFNNAFACLDLEFNNLSCVQNDEEGVSNFEISYLKLTKDSLVTKYIEDGETFTDKVSLPSSDEELGMKWYCQGLNLVTEETFMTNTDTSVAVFNEKGFVLTGSEKLRQCSQFESQEECIANDRPFKELKYTVTCSVKN